MARTPTSVLDLGCSPECLRQRPPRRVLFGFGAQRPSWDESLLLAMRSPRRSGAPEQFASALGVEMTVSRFSRLCSRLPWPLAQQRPLLVGAASRSARSQASVYAGGLSTRRPGALTGAMTGAAAMALCIHRPPRVRPDRSRYHGRRHRQLWRRHLLQYNDAHYAPLCVSKLFINAAAPFLLLALPLHVPVVALMVYGYRNYLFWMAATFLCTCRCASETRSSLSRAARSKPRPSQRRITRLEQASLVIRSRFFVATLDARDRYTAGHSAAVVIYARDIAERLGLTPREQQLAHLARARSRHREDWPAPWPIEKPDR